MSHLKSSFAQCLVLLLKAGSASTCHPDIFFRVSEYCFTSPSAQSWQYRNRMETEVRLCPTLIEWLQGFSTVYMLYHRQHYTPRVFVQFGALYMHNLDDRWLTSHPAGIQTQYLCVLSHNRTEWETGAGQYIYYMKMTKPHRHETLNQCWFNYRLRSEILAQQLDDIGSAPLIVLIIMELCEYRIFFTVTTLSSTLILLYFR